FSAMAIPFFTYPIRVNSRHIRIKSGLKSAHKSRWPGSRGPVQLLFQRTQPLWGIALPDLQTTGRFALFTRRETNWGFSQRTLSKKSKPAIQTNGLEHRGKTFSSAHCLMRFRES